MQRIITFTLFYIVTILSAGPGVAGAANAMDKVAILPFNAAEAGKYEVLKDGLKSMISSRLAVQESIVIVTPALSGSEQEALSAGYPQETGPLFKKLGTDFIGTGRMALVEGKLQLQLTFYSAKGTPSVSVAGEAESDQHILPTVDILVLQIEEQVFGLKNTSSMKDSAVTQKKGTEGFQTEHPDRLYKEEIVTGAAVSAEDGGVAIARGDLLRRKSVLEDGIISMAVEDLDGDGSDEILIVSGSNLKVMHYDRGLLKQLSQYDFSGSLEVHAVNTADLNDDGMAEIYLSAVDNNLFSSVILTWSGENGFQVVQDTIRFALRPLALPDGTSLLVGQGKAIGDEKFLAPGIYVIERDQNGKISQKSTRMFLPPEVNLFDFIIADLDNDGVAEKMAVTRDLKLVVYDSNNNLLWRSTTDFGGGIKYLGRRWSDNLNKQSGSGNTNKDGFTNADLYYIPVRLIARDGNNDGKVDIIVAKNELSTFKVLKNLRAYKTGKVVCMSWNGSSLQEVWTTDTMDGYVADFYFSNELEGESMTSGRQIVENEGKVRLILGQVPSAGLENLMPFGDESANLVVYEFKISSASPELPGKE